ncbi:serine/threonine-protein kinase [Calothrix sp. 336/3]|uniref:serine/threonine-protein kinase n=1 Tax=Calothrix sp. 336/3 TaxID=1337936 RepID=UPI0004E46D9F|nr:serine/threonine-protein kinase [Calothrix sp. 336/3]AKG23162.1 serine/threonine protein kinase [Calothrix sp. 336/3]
MIYCLNPSCEQPWNPESAEFCQNCQAKLLPLLRNRYRIIQPLGGGGFGRTFLAQDEDKLHEHCVVKQLAPQVQGTSALNKANELFKEEARRLQQLGEHRQIPTLYAYFHHENYLFLVQQLIEGQTLRQELQQQGIFSEPKIWQLLRELLPVLQYVHEHQVIHRDIKPDNIIRRSQIKGDRKQTELVLIDFGVAKQLTETSKELTGTSIGSFGYAPVEQIKFGYVSGASDLFSLGVTCFYLMTDMHPSHLYMEHGFSWVMQWRQYLKFPISEQLSQVLDKLLHREIEQRYQSATEVLADLENAPEWQSQSPVISDNYSLTRTIAPQEIDLTLPPQSLLDLQRSQITTPIEQPVKSAKSWKYPVVFGGMLAVFSLGGYGVWQWQNSLSTLKGHLNSINSLAISRNSVNLVSGSDDKTVKIWNLPNRKLLRTLTGHSDWVYSVAVTTDGKTIVSGSKDGTVKAWNLETGQLLRTFTGHTAIVNSVAIAPDNQTVVSGSYDKKIKVWQLHTGQEILNLTGHSQEVLSVAIAPDGRKLVSTSADRTIKIWDLNTGRELNSLKGDLGGDINSTAISPNGQILATVSDGSTSQVRVWNLNTGRELRPPFTGHTADVNKILFSPNNETIITGSDDGTVRIWNLNTGQEVRSIVTHQGEIYALAIAPDGKTLVTAGKDKNIKIWQIP